MDWLARAVEKDLGIDRRQMGAGPRAQELIALVPTRWLSALREKKLVRFVRWESISEMEIRTYLQCSQAKLPPGLTRVCVQGLRKSKLGYRLVRDPCLQPNDSTTTESYVSTMQHVSLHNVRNLWREAYSRLVRPYAGASEQMHLAAVDAVRHALQKLFNTSFISCEKLSPSPSPAREREHFSPSAAFAFTKPNQDHLCPNVLPAECLLETAEMLYVVLPYTQYSLHDIVSFSPAKLANSHAKVLFIIYQLLTAIQACHASGLSCGDLSLSDIAVDEQLCSCLKLNLAHYEDLGAPSSDCTASQAPESISTRVAFCSSPENKMFCNDCFHELKTLVLDWVHGRVSNFCYLMELNRLAGRREGDPNYHPVLPWVVDFTVPFGKFRDLRRSKFRLNKGDKQLDFTYEMTKEALAAVGSGIGGVGVGGDLSGSVSASGAGQPDHLHVPHHISDVLSDITYYVYKARQTPKSVLCSHVRSQWEPNEYPSSMERMQSWTPDECIPEFYTDPSIFRSIHPDMPDLDVPPWCKSCEEFIEVHQRLLESREVSQNLHHWIDLNFGFKLSGKDAVKAKNVCLHLVDNHTHLTTYGVVQLFDQPHPPRLSPSQYAPAEPPILSLAVLDVPSLHIPQIDLAADSVNGMVPESMGCESSSWTMVDRDEELEQGTEALDSLMSAGSSNSASCAGQLPNINTTGGKIGDAALVSQAQSSFSGDCSSSGLRSAVLQRGGLGNKRQGEGSVTMTNTADIKIILPEGFNPLQPLEELEKLKNFLVKSLHAQGSYTDASECELSMIETSLSLTRLYQRDMQALGVLIAEIFYSSKIRGLKSDATLQQRFHAVLKLCSVGFRDIPLSLHHALEKLLQIDNHSGVAQRETGRCQRPLLFDYDPICAGLPAPNPSQLLNLFITPFPFPSYFAALHRFIFSYHSKMETICSLQGREVVFQLWQQLETLLRANVTAEGLEILLPFILALMLDESTAVYAAWYMFEPISRVLGPRNANKYLLKPLVNVYENPNCLRGRFYLYTDCFVLQLIVRLGLQAFLSNLLPHVLLVLTGFESRTSDSAGEPCKGMQSASCTLGEEEEERFQAGDVHPSTGSVSGNMGCVSGASGGVGVVGDTGLVDYSSGISLNDQVFLSEAEDFQNEFYVNSAGGDSGKQPDHNSAAKDQDHESLSVGKLSDKSSASELSLGDGDSMRDRASLKSADSNQDLKLASEGEEGAELDEEEATDANDCKVEADDLSTTKQELSFSACTEASVATVSTLQSEFMNGMGLEGSEKGIMEEQEEEGDQDPSEESRAKEQKILLDTVCKTIRWLSAKLGPTVTSRFVARNLLRLLTNCYIGPESHYFITPSPEESTLESVGMGSIYEKRPVVGDQTAAPVLDCLIYIAQLYGEPVLTYQYLPYIGYLVSPPSSQRLNTRKEASLLGAVALTQKIVVFLSDTTLMDILMKINQDVLLPLLDLLTNPHMGFPSGGQTRTVVCLKTLSLMALICLRIGREMVQQHMADTLRRFFAVFSLLHCLRPQMESAPRRVVGEVTVVVVSTPEEPSVTYELSILEELQSVFSTEMAHASYIPFYCLIGDMAIRKLVPNHELIWQLASSYHQSVSHTASSIDMPPSSSFGPRKPACYGPFPSPSTSSTPLGDPLPESGTFGSRLVGNRIQVSRDSYFGGSPNMTLGGSWGQTNHITTTISTPSTVNTPSISALPFSSSWVTGPPLEDSALKQELARSGRSLQGNWLAYWQYEIGLNQQDPHFHFHQIRLQSFPGHSGATKCLASLAGEDYFLSGGKDKTVKLWPLYNHGDGTQEIEPRLTYTDHKKSVFYVGQLEASQEVVSCDGTVHLWDQYTGRRIRSYEAVDGKNPITAVTTMPAPHCSVVFGSADSVLRFIDPRKPGLQHEFRLAYNNLSAGLIRYLAVSPTGRTVAAGFSSGFIVMLDARTGLVLRGWPAHEGDILQMKATEGNLVISSSTDYTLAVWKDLEHKPLRQYKLQSDPVHALDFYGSEIVTGTMANKVGVYSMADISLSPISSTKLSTENFRGTLTSLAVLPTKRLLLLGSDNGAIRLLA
ncbi:WD repeat-containing protein 81 [Corythoichthys intestinalis]|uniref:WD repeat-containing protein 81 n=1 Tax=Corythoichthys intestinalis TaxID=161448 RepID=UPI0025A5CC0F|nr:WD repeat-containing protein 81 [Corythoichthys intestinalis]XP_061797655.1 WD repeat-containing protein 81-like [Nerophis lumbriciformis]